MRGATLAEKPFPVDFYQTLQIRHRITRKIREFFDNRNYLEVETPIRVPCPGIDPYLDALPAGSGFYLATSPELQMKRLLGLKIPCIYQLTHAFRANERGALHNAEFSLLEWYRTNTDYLGIMDETEAMLKVIIEDLDLDKSSAPKYAFPFDRIYVDDLFKALAGWQPSRNWNEDRYFFDWVEKIEPFLASQKGVFVIDFPAPIAALAKIKESNPLVSERFELFMHGIEIANAFTELTDHQEQAERFKEARKKRLLLGKEVYAVDEKFLAALQAGIPECGGIALGIDRLIMAVLGLRDIAMVQTFPLSRL